jgi:glycosyltransferase involved in cell wall biosynthesis
MRSGKSGPAIHQFHSGSASGDAVTNGLLFTQGLLRELGFQSRVFVEHLAPELRGSLEHFTSYEPSARATLLVHHSMGHEQTGWLAGLPDRRILVYHNITPEQFFAAGSGEERAVRKGRQQLSEFRSFIDASICMSAFSATELEQLGYPRPAVIPLLADFGRLAEAPFADRIVQDNAAFYTLLFVGRVVPHKRIEDLIAIFGSLSRTWSRPSQLVVVGGCDLQGPYHGRLMSEARRLGVAEQVRFTGKVSDEELRAWYRVADAYLCTSEHEGFGVPLVEAMTLDLPVVAHRSASVPETLGGAGLLLESRNPAEAAALLQVLAEDPALRRAVVLRQADRAADFSRPRLLVQLAEFLASCGLPAPRPPDSVTAAPRRTRFQIEGPFETSYSLALVNRETARALELAEPGGVALFATEGPGDYQPAPQDLAAHAELGPLWRRARKGARPEVAIRNLYPPRVADADGLVNLLSFAWEESLLPHDWVQTFNLSLDGMAVTSTYVQKVLVDSGVSVPVFVVGNGYDHVQRVRREPFPGTLGRGFRFLHVSSAFPRKGVDALLAAYGQAFGARDDVTLVLKTFPNQHNAVAALLAEHRERPGYPDVVHVDQDLPPGQLVDLYQRCHAFVAPSRGEGFGLPLAEAMFFGLPVITTAWGGQSDFCRPDTAWLVDFRFERARSHFDQFNSVWTEPDQQSLAGALRAVHQATPEERQQRVGRAQVALQSLRWSDCADRIRQAVATIDRVPPLTRRATRLGWVSSWNTRCGIATYSRYLLDQLDPERLQATVFANRADQLTRPDEPHVVRCWDDAWRPSLDDLEGALASHGIEVVVVQFNFGFYGVAELAGLLDRLHRRGVRTVVVFHSTADVDKPDFKGSLRTVAGTLRRCERLLVHGLEDLARLKSFGLVANVTLFPHGVREVWEGNAGRARAALGLPPHARIVGTYGFLLPHKGVEQLVEALPRLLVQEPSAHLLLVNSLYPVPESRTLQARCRARIDQLELGDRVTMLNDFLSDEEALGLLEAADVVVFPYQQTAESASGAVRFGLCTGRPVAVTPSPIFDDVRELVHTLPGQGPLELAEGLAALLADPVRLAEPSGRQRRWVGEHAWPRLGRRLEGMLLGLSASPRPEFVDRSGSEGEAPPADAVHAPARTG